VTIEPTTAAGARLPPPRERRATTAFTLIALFNLVVLVFFAGAVPLVPTIARLVTFGGPILTAGVLLTAALGLATGRAWASSVATPMLQLLIVAGGLNFVVALLHGRLDIPIVAGLAIWALAARPAPATRRVPASGAVLLGAAVLAASWPLLSSVALQPGGPLIAAQSDLQFSATASGGCSGPEVPSSGFAPATVDVTVSWAWSRADLVALGTDTVSIEWFTNRGDGLSGYTLDTVHPLEAGLIEANRFIGDSGAIVFAIDLAERGFESGIVTITMRRPNAVPATHGSLELHARYAHGPSDVYGLDPAAIWIVKDVTRCGW
jgi:hypothetical protein